MTYNNRSYAYCLNCRKPVDRNYEFKILNNTKKLIEHLTNKERLLEKNKILRKKFFTCPDCGKGLILRIKKKVKNG